MTPREKEIWLNYLRDRKKNKKLAKKFERKKKELRRILDKIVHNQKKITKT